MKKILKEETGYAVEISAERFASECGLEILYSTGKNILLNSVNVNRPGFILSGYDGYFAKSRIQVMGKSEFSYLETLDADLRQQRFRELFSKKFPCMIIARALKASPELLAAAREFKVPVFRSEKITARLTFDMTIYLGETLAPYTTMHAVFVDIFGEGVLIKGSSGIGKSETALELIHRGHRLISDDVVDLKELDNGLLGTSPEITQHMLEIRGLGIIDVKAVYGIGAVLKRKHVSLIIELEKWDEDKSYDRLGKTRITEDVLGVEIPKYVIPVTAGRNIAILIEVAVRDFRLRQSGYNPLEEIDKRMS